MMLEVRVYPAPRIVEKPASLRRGLRPSGEACSITGTSPELKNPPRSEED